MRVAKTAAALIVAALALTGCVESTTSLPDASAGITELESSTAQAEPTEPGTAALSDAEVLLAALMGPDGEYAAAASYLAVLDEYGQVEPYATIYEAELRHVDALIRQLERLGEVVPVNPYLGQISAPADLETAAQAWAEGEILNVELYDYLITQTSNSQILKVLGNLRRASLESHLPAFELAAENGGTLDSMPSGGRQD